MVRRAWGLAIVLLFALCGTAGAQADLGGVVDDALSDLSLGAAVSLGTALDGNGNLAGESTRFAANVGAVYCRVVMIGADRSHTLTLTWYREGQEVGRSALTLAPGGAATDRRAVAAAQTGSWRVEVTDETGNVLAVVPFIVGQPSESGQPIKKPTSTPTPTPLGQ